MSTQITRTTEFINHITGSAGNWPSLSNAGILGGIDYLIESGSNEVKFIEMNTNIGIVGSAAIQTGSYFDVISDYVNDKGYTTTYVYGVNHNGKKNPSTLQQPLISASFARHDITTNFEYGDSLTRTYFLQRGDEDHLDKFHLWMQTPWYSDDNLKSIVSGSFDKNTFRTFLGNSPFSSSLIPSFDKDNYTPNNNYPDFVVKTATQDSSVQTNKIGFYTYNSTSSSYQNGVDSGSLIEEYIVHSGSYRDGQSHLGVGKIEFMMTTRKGYCVW